MANLQILLPFLLIAFSICLSQCRQNINDIFPLLASVQNRNVNNLPDNENCPCFPIPSNGNSVLEKLGLIGKSVQRIVFYAYRLKDTNEIILYVPNLRKQRLFPELPYDDDDVHIEFNPQNILYKYINGFANYIPVESESGRPSDNFNIPGNHPFNIHLNLPQNGNEREEESLQIIPGTLSNIPERPGVDSAYYEELEHPVDNQVPDEIKPTVDSISSATDNNESDNNPYKTEQPVFLSETESPLLSESSPDQKTESPKDAEPAELKDPSKVSDKPPVRSSLESLNQVPNGEHLDWPTVSNSIQNLLPNQHNYDIPNEDLTAFGPGVNNFISPGQQIHVQPGFFGFGKPNYQAYQYQLPLSYYDSEQKLSGNSQPLPTGIVLPGQEENEQQNSGPLDTTFDAWFAAQLKNVFLHGPVVDEIDSNSLKAFLQKTLLKQGIYVNQNGLLIDSKGSPLDLANLHLRPMLIGSTVPYQKLIKGESLKPVNTNEPYLEVLLISLANPPKILGLIPLGITYVPTTAHKLPKQVRNNRRKPDQFDTNSVFTRYLSSNGIYNKIPQPTVAMRSNINQQQQELLRPPVIMRSIKIKGQFPPKRPDFIDFRSNGIESSDLLAGIKPLRHIYNYILGNNKNFTDTSKGVTEPPKDIRYRIIGGNSALNSGPVVNVKGRTGWDDYFGKW